LWFVWCCCQGKSAEAIAANQAAKLSQTVALDKPEEESALVPEGSEGETEEHRPCPDMAAGALSDKHFAVSEACVDRARQSFREAGNKNWLDHCHDRFRQEHGHIQGSANALVELPQDEEDDDDSDEEEETVCEAGLCHERDIEPCLVIYNKLHEQVKNVLRYMRDCRRKFGFTANHVVLLWYHANSDVGFEDEFKVVMLTRLMFKPFDCTAIQLDRCSHDASLARINVNDAVGILEFLSLPQMLHKYSKLGDDISFKMASYKAVSLREILIDLSSLQTFEQAISLQKHAVHDEPSTDESDGDTADVKKRMELLRKLRGNKDSKGKDNQKAKKKTRKDQVQKNKPRKGGNTSKKSDPAGINAIDDHPNEPGESGQAHDTLMGEWRDALEAQQGPLPLVEKAQSCRGAKKQQAPTVPASSKTEPDEGPAKIPIVSREHPWRDQKGHCWRFNAETGKPFHIGQALRPFSVMINDQCDLLSSCLIQG